MISYKHRDNELLVFIPSSLKDAFKQHFINATYDRDLACWIISDLYEVKLQKLILSLKTEIAAYNKTLRAKVKASADTHLTDDEVNLFRAKAEQEIIKITNT